MQIVLHPSMTGVQISAWCEAHRMDIEVAHRPGRVASLLVTATPRTKAGSPEFTTFVCDSCSWVGGEPLWFDAEPEGFPSVADVPVCPSCRHHELRLVREVLACPITP